MKKELHRYKYEGPVMEFDRCIDYHWYGETVALSKEKAKSNFVYQFKRRNGKSPRSKIILPGKIVEID